MGEVMKRVGIISYGLPEDRDKAKILAQLEKVSVSELIVRLLRERYDETFSVKPIKENDDEQ